jgi:hypothetical protein
MQRTSIGGTTIAKDVNVQVDEYVKMESLMTKLQTYVQPQQNAER